MAPVLRLVSLIAIAVCSLRAANFDLRTATVADINAQFDSGALTSEKLVTLCLARITAYEPSLHAVITLNPQALAEARALDRERRESGRRSPLHGIPVLLKDNIDTADLPTTAGFFALKGSIPPRDATVVEKLRKAGAIILAKVNLSEFASGSAMSSLGGQSHNPHNLAVTPSGSSGGTAVGVAAGYASIGLGSDTGGSIRAPASVDGVVGLRPTHGLVSGAGVIPLAPSCDVVGPMARSVYDVAAVLEVLAGADERDEASTKMKDRPRPDYTSRLRSDALRGARIGVARAFMGQDPDVDRVIEAALSRMKSAGATLVDISLPEWVMKSKEDIYNTIRRSEFPPALERYLLTTRPGFPKTHAQITELAARNAEAPLAGMTANPSRLELYRQEASAPPTSDPVYRSARDEGMALMRASILAVLTRHQLDAFVYPPVPKKPARLPSDTERLSTKSKKAAPEGKKDAPPTVSGTHLSSLSGLPDLIVPAGFTDGGLPVGISFVGRPAGEAHLLALGYALERFHPQSSWPQVTPALAGESF